MTKPSLSCLALVALAIAAPRRAAAQDATPKPAEETPLKTGYISFSPIHLTRPILELTGEMRLGRRSGIAVITGAGTIAQRAYWNVGGQLLFYPIGNFERGIQVGFETSYAGYAGDRAPNIIAGPVNALALSPLVGFKWTFSSFTMSSQAGCAWAPGATPGHRWSALYNLNVGWSF